MRRLFQVSSIISAIITLASFGTYFFVFDKWSESNLFLVRGFGFLGISLMLFTYQYEYRHYILSANKKQMSKIIFFACMLIGVVFLVLSIIQFCNHK